jgi:hypothetical protein
VSCWGDNAIFTPEAIVCTSLLRSLSGGYDPSSPLAAEILLWLRAAMSTNVGRVDCVEGYYCTHADEMPLITYALKWSLESRRWRWLGI